MGTHGVHVNPFGEISTGDLIILTHSKHRNKTHVHPIIFAKKNEMSRHDT
jgi:hypothetical protein